MGKEKDKEQNSHQKVPWTKCVDQKQGVNSKEVVTLLLASHNGLRSPRSLLNWGPLL